MKIPKKLIKLWSGLIFLAFFLNGCLGNSENSNPVLTKPNKVASLNKSNNSSLDNVDLYSLNYGQSESQTTCNNNVCITLKNIPYALYHDNLWLQEYYPTELKVTFNANIKNFTIHDIFNDLEETSHQLVGKIEQINTKNCDNLLAEGFITGKSCTINFNYRGIAKNNQYSNQIHINFNLDEEIFSFQFRVTNHQVSDSSVPILDAQNESMLKIVALPPTKSDIGITYPRELFNQFTFINQGSTLKSAGSAASTLSFSFANPDSVSGNNILEFMYYLFPQQTTCGSGDIVAQQICSVPLLLKTKQQGDISSYINNYLVNYTINNNSQSQIINSVHPFVVSLGA